MVLMASIHQMEFQMVESMAVAQNRFSKVLATLNQVRQMDSEQLVLMEAHHSIPEIQTISKKH